MAYVCLLVFYMCLYYLFKKNFFKIFIWLC